MKEEEEVARDIVFEQTVQIYQNDYLLAESCQGYFNHGWNAAIAYAKRERQWVPIHGEDDLPEGDSEFVLVQWKSGAMSIYSFSFRDDPPSDYEYPVAYMPLPDPYQPKTDGDKAEGE